VSSCHPSSELPSLLPFICRWVWAHRTSGQPSWLACVWGISSSCQKPTNGSVTSGFTQILTSMALFYSHHVSWLSISHQGFVWRWKWLLYLFERNISSAQNSKTHQSAMV
jgi:hypothetical protein